MQMALPTIGSMISAGDLAAAFVEQRRRGVEIVVGQGQRQVGERLRHAGRVGHAEASARRSRP